MPGSSLRSRLLRRWGHSTITASSSVVARYGQQAVPTTALSSAPKGRCGRASAASFRQITICPKMLQRACRCLVRAQFIAWWYTQLEAEAAQTGVFEAQIRHVLAFGVGLTRSYAA